MPAEVLPRGIDESAWSRLSSFGFSGTIAHALVALDRAQMRSSMSSTASGTSLYRRAVLPVGSAGCRRLVARPRLAEARGSLQDDVVVSAEALISHHVVGGSLLLPGVGYVEVALVADARRRSALWAVAFVRGAARERCALRRTRLFAGAFEIGRRARSRRKETRGAATGCPESLSTHLETRSCAW